MGSFVPDQPQLFVEDGMVDATNWYTARIEKLDKPPIPIEEQEKSWLAIHKKILGRYLSEVEIDFIQRDLVRLRNNPRVDLLRVGCRSIVIRTSRVEPTFECFGAKYTVFLAVWALAIELFETPQGERVRAHLVHLETGSLKNQAPKYTMTSTGMGFCFGDRVSHITELLQAGALADGIEVILEWLWHVNPSDIQSVIQQYQLLEKVVTDPAEDAKPKPSENLFGDFGGLDDG
jgi:hypothetical protein